MAYFQFYMNRVGDSDKIEPPFEIHSFDELCNKVRKEFNNGWIFNNDEVSISYVFRLEVPGLPYEVFVQNMPIGVLWYKSGDVNIFDHMLFDGYRYKGKFND